MISFKWHLEEKVNTNIAGEKLFKCENILVAYIIAKIFQSIVNWIGQVTPA